VSQIVVELQSFMGTDRDIANAAWTSSTVHAGSKMRSDDEVNRLLKYLVEHKHSTPFESVVLRFWIKMPITTDRQFMTHRIQSTSGMSGRYRTMPREYLTVPSDVLEILNKGDLSDYGYIDTCDKANHEYEHFIDMAKHELAAGTISNDEYKRLREFMRGMLPQHNMTERVSIMNLRAFCNFQKLRNSEQAQPEIREVAQGMLAAVKSANVAPTALSLLEECGWSI